MLLSSAGHVAPTSRDHPTPYGVLVVCVCVCGKLTNRLDFRLRIVVLFEFGGIPLRVAIHTIKAHFHAKKV